MRLPMPRDLKEPAGWRFSSLRKMRLAWVVSTATEGGRVGEEAHTILQPSKAQKTPSAASRSTA